METDDVLALCAPRPILIVSGTEDHIYPYDAARRVFEHARPAWVMKGAAERLAILGPVGPHRFYPDDVWPTFMQLIGHKEARPET